MGIVRIAHRLAGASLALLAAACATPAPRTGELDLAAAPAGPPSAAAPAAPAAQEADAGSWRGGFHALLGYRALDEETWAATANGSSVSLDQQFALGLEFDLRPPDFPLGIEAGLQVSAIVDSTTITTTAGPVGVDFTGSVYEFYLGPRLSFDLGDGKIHPYVGGGLTWLLAEIEAEVDVGGLTGTISQDEDSLAGYAHAGILFDVGESFHLGADARFVAGSDLGNGADADYWQLALVLGSSW